MAELAVPWPGGTLTRPWVLVIEDNPGDVALLQMAVDKTTFRELRHLPDGEQAVNLLLELAGTDLQSLPDVIILDLNLPRVDGYQIIQTLSSQQTLRRIAVLVLTSSGSPAEKLRALRAGADVYCTKPMDLDGYLSLPTVIEEAREKRDHRLQS